MSKHKNPVRPAHPEDGDDRKRPKKNPLAGGLRSRPYTLDLVPRVRYWCDVLERAEKQNSHFSKWQVVKDLLDFAHQIAYDDGCGLKHE